MSETSKYIQDSSEELLNDIQSLQQTEQDLFNSLENNLTPEQQEQILNKINQVTTMRINLYQALGNINGFFQNALKTSYGTLKDQSVAINIVEEELNRMKQNLSTLQEEKNNKLRIVEINTYFGEKYAEHAQLMKIVIFTLIPVIILALIYRSGILPPAIYYILLCIIAAVGGYYFWKRMASIVTRDNMYYSEYDWYFDPASAPSPTGNTTDPWASSDMGICIGQGCCSTGQTYDASLNVCIGDSTIIVNGGSTSTSSSSSSSSSSSPTSSSGCPLVSSSSTSTSAPTSSSTSGSTSTLESFINYNLTKTSTTNKYKFNNMFSSPKPSNSNSFIYLSSI
jgi:hypothetical protein